MEAPPSPLSSRPKKSWAFGPPKVVKESCRSATTLNGSAALPFVISTGAPKERSGEICGVSGPFLEMFSKCPANSLLHSHQLWTGAPCSHQRTWANEDGPKPHQRSVFCFIPQPQRQLPRPLPQRRKKIINPSGIQHILFRQPSPSQLSDPIMHSIEMTNMVRIRINHDVATQFPCPAQVDIAKVKPVRVSIMLDCDTNLRCLFKHRG